MLKRSLALGLSVLLVAGAIAGCSGGSGASESKAAGAEKAAEAANGEQSSDEKAASGERQASNEEKTLTVFHYMGQSVKQEGLEKLEEEFKKTHPNITFENIFYNQGTDYFPQLAA